MKKNTCKMKDDKFKCKKDIEKQKINHLKLSMETKKGQRSSKNLYKKLDNGKWKIDKHHHGKCPIFQGYKEQPKQGCQHPTLTKTRPTATLGALQCADKIAKLV